jgi:hypothetical protein
MFGRARRAAAVLGAVLVLGLAAPAGSAENRPGGAPPAAATAEAPAAGATAAHQDDDVYVVQQRPDGTVYSAVYKPAAGVTGDELRDQLRREGVRGVLDQGRKAPNGRFAALGCAPFVGTASAWCNNKWGYGPFNDPQVYFLDHTSSSWPVTDARIDWYQAPGIDAYYRWHTAGCPGGGRHCVHVYNGNYGTGWYGMTSAVSSGGLFVDGTVKIELNDQVTPNTYAARRSVACHEMGHALGLDHNGSTNSCLSVPQFPQHPSADDFGVLNLLYPKPGT